MDCVDGTSVCMYGGHSVLRSNSKLHDNFGKMETHARPRMPCIILVWLTRADLGVGQAHPELPEGLKSQNSKDGLRQHSH